MNQDEELAESVFPLLSLPAHVSAEVVQRAWPHLGPYSRSQLRAACRELRALTDDLVTSLTCVLDAQHLPSGAEPAGSTGACTQLPGAAPVVYDAADRLPSTTRLLSRCTKVDTLKVIVAGVTSSDLPADGAEGVAAALKQLGAACSGSDCSIRSLTVRSREESAAFRPVGLAAAISSFPSLQHLSISGGHKAGSEQEWEEAAAHLQQLQHLTRLEWDGVGEFPTGPATTGMLRTVTQLTGLRSLDILAGDNCYLDAAAASANSHLTELHLRHVLSPDSLERALSRNCSSIKTLGLPVQAFGRWGTPEAQRAITHDNLPSLTSLSLNTNYTSPPEHNITAELAARLTRVTCLAIEDRDVAAQFCAEPSAPGALQHLQHVRLHNAGAAGLANLVVSHPHLTIEVEDSMDVASLDGATLGAAAAAEVLSAAFRRHTISGRLHGSGPLVLGGCKVTGLVDWQGRPLREASAATALLHGMVVGIEVIAWSRAIVAGSSVSDDDGQGWLLGALRTLRVMGLSLTGLGWDEGWRALGAMAADLTLFPALIELHLWLGFDEELVGWAADSTYDSISGLMAARPALIVQLTAASGEYSATPNMRRMVVQLRQVVPDPDRVVMRHVLR